MNYISDLVDTMMATADGSRFGFSPPFTCSILKPTTNSRISIRFRQVGAARWSKNGEISDRLLAVHDHRDVQLRATWGAPQDYLREVWRDSERFRARAATVSATCSAGGPCPSPPRSAASTTTRPVSRRRGDQAHR